jgi:hypothetical protein
MSNISGEVMGVLLHEDVNERVGLKIRISAEDTHAVRGRLHAAFHCPSLFSTLTNKESTSPLNGKIRSIYLTPSPAFPWKYSSKTL